ncbi:hypothetical protein LZ30DRAFT_442513 [Colletotrichum cereale]|nr:hypothetical protein LZ30DRAFT_442513 [Colletotrichum cereale]
MPAMTPSTSAEKVESIGGKAQELGTSFLPPFSAKSTPRTLERKTRSRILHGAQSQCFPAAVMIINMPRSLSSPPCASPVCSRVGQLVLSEVTLDVEPNLQREPHPMTHSQPRLTIALLRKRSSVLSVRIRWVYTGSAVQTSQPPSLVHRPEGRCHTGQSSPNFQSSSGSSGGRPPSRIARRRTKPARCLWRVPGGCLMTTASNGNDDNAHSYCVHSSLSSACSDACSVRLDNRIGPPREPGSRTLMMYVSDGMLRSKMQQQYSGKSEQ